MSSAALDLDLATIVGEMEDVPCEHSQHGRHPNHGGGPATHYVRGICLCSGPTEAYAACPKFVRFARSSEMSICGQCGRLATGNEQFEVVGPVNGRAS